MLHKLSLTHLNKHPAEFSLHKRGSIKGGAHKEADETETKDPGTKGPGPNFDPNPEIDTHQISISLQVVGQIRN